jgi:hypothetical protein
MSGAVASLLGALVGGLAAIGGAWLQARNTARLQREEADRQEEQRRGETAHRWDTKRLDCYREFAVAIKHFISISQRLSADRGLPATAQAYDSKTGLPMLAAADEDLSVEWENVLMLGKREAITADYEWRLVAWHIEWFARGLRDDPAEYEQANTDSGEKRQRFYSAVREDLGVIGGPMPDLPWPPDWLQSVERPPGPSRT